MRRMRLVLLTAAAAFAATACHNQPPVPSQPTNPTNREVADTVIDASIVDDAGGGFDAAIGVIDAAPTRR